MGRMTSHILWEKHVPNHQPEMQVSSWENHRTKGGIHQQKQRIKDDK
jgi:hypothetical protein